MSRLTSSELIVYDCIFLDYDGEGDGFSFEWKFKIRRDFDVIVFDLLQLPYKQVAVSFCVNFSGMTKILHVDMSDCRIGFDGNIVVVKGTCNSMDSVHNGDVSYESHYVYYDDDIYTRILNYKRDDAIPWVFVYVGGR